MTVLRIDYSVPVTIDFCSRSCTLGGKHDGYPSFVAFVQSEKVYDNYVSLRAKSPACLRLKITHL
jgi:hypothetical protein